MLDRDTWMLHRDQMALLNRIESLLTVAHHERKAIRREIKALTELLSSLKSEPKDTFDWRHLMDSTLSKVLLGLFLGATGVVGWAEAVKVAIN